MSCLIGHYLFLGADIGDLVRTSIYLMHRLSNVGLYLVLEEFHQKFKHTGPREYDEEDADQRIIEGKKPGLPAHPEWPVRVSLFS